MTLIDTVRHIWHNESHNGATPERLMKIAAVQQRVIDRVARPPRGAMSRQCKCGCAQLRAVTHVGRPDRCGGVSACSALPAAPAIWGVTVRAYDGNSDEYGRPLPYTVSVEQCAPSEDMAAAIVLSSVEGQVLNVDVEPTYEPAYGNGSAACTCADYAATGRECQAMPRP